MRKVSAAKGSNETIQIHTGAKRIEGDERVQAFAVRCMYRLPSDTLSRSHDVVRSIISANCVVAYRVVKVPCSLRDGQVLELGQLAQRAR